MQQNNATAPVLVTEIPLPDGKIAGQLTLNKPASLNALDLSMAQIMLTSLTEFAHREDVVLVFIDATGDKAFCAGGDIVSMYRAMQQAPGEIPDFIQRFFTLEYRLDHLIHTFPKPVMVWGHGIVMGGGMGLLNGASHRVVTPASRLAMPEITIGLYPDVGGSYFLPRLPGHSGLFLGLTGASINATDACFLTLADYYCDTSAKQHVLDTLQRTVFSPRTAHDQLSALISQYNVAIEERIDGQVEGHLEAINLACEADDVSVIAKQILTLNSTADKWLQRAQQTLAKGSPITAHLVFQQILRGATMSLADCFRMEMTMSCRCGEFGELQEGVRALLIDKDNQPAWKYSAIDTVPTTVVSHFFADIWDVSQHPLADLGA